MNLITLGIFAFIAIGFLVGWYKGFLNTVCNVISIFAAWVLAFFFNGLLSSIIAEKTDIATRLLYYTAGAEKLSDMTVANIDTATLTTERIREIIYSSNIPSQIAPKMESNIINQVFYNDGIYTLSEYFNQTLINISLNLICFLLIYFAVRIILSFLIELGDRTFIFPVLKNGDSVLGGLFGCCFGIMGAFVVFSVLPIIFSVIDIPFLETMVDESWLGSFFYKNNIIINILSGLI